MSALTPEDFVEGIRRLSDGPSAEVPDRLVAPQAWSRFQEFLAEPRLAHHPKALLLSYAEVGATPPLKTCSYALGKSARRASRRASRVSSKQ